MKILVGKTFGIGNAILSIPMIKALSTLGEVDVLVGDTADDIGSVAVLSRLKEISELIIAPRSSPVIPFDLRKTYDVAVMAIPFDGRWVNGRDFNAKRVIDGRKRPGNVERLGFDMWEKHEVEYQMENAYELGYSGPIPDCSFMPEQLRDPDLVYLGLGYKRDPGGFGLSKHFGTGRYGDLVAAVRKLRPTARFISTGNMLDMIEVGNPIARQVDPFHFQFVHKDLLGSFDIVSRCGSYIGNDTGMMHAAASVGIPTCGLFAYPDLVTKNPPFCEKSLSIVFGKDFPSVDYIAEQFVQFVWGDK